MQNLNSLTSASAVEIIMKYLPTKRTLVLYGFTCIFYIEGRNNIGVTQSLLENMGREYLQLVL